MQRNAWTAAKAPPAAMAPRIDNQGLCVASATKNAVTAPTSIMPSTPKFNTPERSASISPSAARVSGTPNEIAPANAITQTFALMPPLANDGMRLSIIVGPRQFFGTQLGCA
ncbi:unannotated protein [freshwater metagenome]|uniref:Unannotated protein n=1 Tax=freshwater metagenome TaxID=449393 RepID=A0A6J6MIS7_9ZZZZ